MIPFTPDAVRPNGRRDVSWNRINDACAVPIKISCSPSVKRTAISSSSFLKPMAILPFLLMCEKLLNAERLTIPFFVAKTKKSSSLSKFFTAIIVLIFSSLSNSIALTTGIPLD